MHDIRYIDTDDELAERCAALRGSRAIALDTEFIRERTYFPGICLVQLTAGADVLLVDPLAVKGLQPLYELLFDPSITKVLHAARQDFEIFFHLAGRLPSPLFDTQIAAGLAGFSDQVGYAALVESLLGVTLDKSHTRTNWQRRPLSPAQLQYAADDVRYLGPVYDRLVETLTRSDRLEWARQDSALLEEPSLYAVHPESAWRRIKAARRLPARQRAALAALAAWRERWAAEADKPRQWLVRDEVLVAIVRAEPATVAQLAAIQGVPERLAQRQGEAILQAMGAPDVGLTDDVGDPPGRPNESETALYKRLQKTVDERAQHMDLPNSVLVPRRDLRRAAGGSLDLPVFRGWRKQAIGDDLRRIITDGDD